MNNGLIDRIERLASSPGIRVVSFDIFDTLVYRSCSLPTDAFSLMGQSEIVLEHFDYPENWQKVRVRAESDARKRSPSDEVTLDEIYREIDLPQSLKIALIRLEIATEKKVIFVNPELDKLIGRLSRHGKRIVCASDMYLSTTQIRTCALNKLENSHLIERIYVSSALRKSKSQRALFAHMLVSEKVEPEEVLHVGDNQISDVDIPASIGLKTAKWAPTDHFPEVISHEKRYSPATISQINHARRESLMRNPFEDDPHRFYFELGASIFGPVLYFFSAWLLSVAEQKKLNQIAFMTREGKLFQECIARYVELNHLSSPPELILLHISRRAASLPLSTAIGWEKFRDLTLAEFCEICDVKVDDMPLGSRSLSLKDAVEEDVVDKTKLLSSMLRCQKKLKVYAEQQRQLLHEHLDDIGYLEPLVVDFGGGGTVMKLLQNLPAGRVPPFNALLYQQFEGAHVDPVASFFPVSHRTYHGLKLLRRSAGVVEFFLNQDEATTIRYEKDGEQKTVAAILGSKPSVICETDFESMVFTPFRAGVFGFFSVASRLFEHALPTLDLREMLTSMLTRLVSYPTSMEAKAIGMLPFETDLTGDRAKIFIGEQQKWDSIKAVEHLSDPNSDRWDVEWPRGQLINSFPQIGHGLYSSLNDEKHTIDVIQLVSNTLALRDAESEAPMNVAVWGAGQLGARLYAKLQQFESISVSQWVDSRALLDSIQTMDRAVNAPDQISWERIDALIIASRAFKEEILESIQTDFGHIKPCLPPIVHL